LVIGLRQNSTVVHATFKYDDPRLKMPHSGCVPTRHFYRAMLCIRAVLAMGLCPSVCLCLSVCLSVTSRCSTKTAKRRITQTTPHNTTGTLVFLCQRSLRNSTGVTPCEGAECRWDGQNRRLSTNNRLYLENGKRQTHSFY